MKRISNELTRAIYSHNVDAGWWNDNRPDGTTISLIHSEISEAFTGYVEDIKDHHIPEFDNIAVELADAAIRIYDLAGHKGWDLERAAKHNVDNGVWEYVPGELTLYPLCRYIATAQARVSDALEALRKNTFETLPDNTVVSVAALKLATVLHMIYSAGDMWGYDIPHIMDVKREYNSRRADHKLENRAKEDGKKF